MITHYDLFAGIGGFSIAAETIFGQDNIRHIFCEWEQFPTAVLKQHWPDGTYYGDIADLVADTKHQGLERSSQERQRHAGFRSRERADETQDWSIVTGGFPCQPFSAAGRRKGTADDRYQWPNMFEVIRNVKPKWVIAENVRGLVTWNDGMVLEQVCADLESEGYEVQPIIIPAVAVNAPHRRDRVWIIGHTKHDGRNGSENGQSDIEGADRNSTRPNQSQQLERSDISRQRTYPDWQRNWQEVAFATCDDSMDDGLPRKLDGATTRGKRTDQISSAQWRKDSLKAYGNAIVPQVAIEIMKAIKTADDIPARV